MIVILIRHCVFPAAYMTPATRIPNILRLVFILIKKPAIYKNSRMDVELFVYYYWCPYIATPKSILISEIIMFNRSSLICWYIL